MKLLPRTKKQPTSLVRIEPLTTVAIANMPQIAPSRIAFLIRDKSTKTQGDQDTFTSVNYRRVYLKSLTKASIHSKYI